MGKNDHDELMARAQSLTADSPRDTVRRARLDLLDEATGLQRAIGSTLLRNGVPTSRDRDRALRAELDRWEAESEGWIVSDLAPSFPPFTRSAEELAELVAEGSISLIDERLRSVSRLARKLREVTVETARLGRLLDQRATPLIIPDNLDPSSFDVDRDPTIDRRAYALKYSWAIPSEQALEAIVKLGPIIEIGAGSGYWAQLLRERGANVLAFDHQPNPARNHSISRRWGPVREAPATIAGRYPDRTLLLIRPPYHEPMAREALQAYRGDRLAYIGESWGATADDSFFELLDDGWDEVQEIDIPHWGGMHDGLYIYRRRS